MTTLAGQVVLVTGANRGMGREYVRQLLDRDVAKSDPADVVRQVLDGVESGADEVLADEMTRKVRAQLSRPVGA